MDALTDPENSKNKEELHVKYLKEKQISAKYRGKETYQLLLCVGVDPAVVGGGVLSSAMKYLVNDYEQMGQKINFFDTISCNGI